MKTLPKLEEGQYHELIYTVGSVGTKTINSVYQPSISYRFSSPGNISRAMKALHAGSRKVVVMTVEEVVDSRQIYYEDALKLTEFIEMGRNSFVLNVVDIPAKEVVEENIEEITIDLIEEPVVEDSIATIEVEPFDIDIDVSISINAMKEIIESPSLTFTNDTFLELIEEEKQGKNRQTMIKLLESNL